jgi:hypothetical protein
LLWAPAVALAFAACGGGGSNGGPATPTKSGTAVDATGNDDRSRCDFKGRADREVIETAGPGAIQPNVRRVFAIIGEGEEARKVLLCREVDTNLDGMKDVVRTYNDKGEALHEQADSNYNGKIDTWISFARGRISKVELDRNNDGRPDETRYYVDGRLNRAQRDRNFDGKADTWEIYDKGRLQRMGVDLDHDGHVDRWDRDEQAARLAEREEEEEQPEEGPAAPTAGDAGALKASDAGALKGGGVTDAYVSPRKR